MGVKEWGCEEVAGDGVWEGGCGIGDPSLLGLCLVCMDRGSPMRMRRSLMCRGPRSRWDSGVECSFACACVRGDRGGQKGVGGREMGDVDDGLVERRGEWRVTVGKYHDPRVGGAGTLFGLSCIER